MKKILLYTIAFACMQNFVNAQWVATSGPIFANGYAPTVTSMEVKGSTIFAGTTSGMFRSNNNGTTWLEGTTGVTNTNVRKLTASGTHLFLATNISGMYKSANNGSSWTSISNSGFSALNGINCLSSIGTKLFCSPIENGGLYSSADNGATWTNVSANLTNQFFTTVVSNGTILFAGGLSGWGSGGVFSSTDNGVTWNDVNNGALSSGGNISSLAVSGSNIFAGGTNMFLSTDNGSNWTSIDTGLNGYVNSILVDGPTIYAGTFNGVFRSTNNGTNWQAVNTGLGNLKVRTLSKSGTNIVAGTDSLVWIRPISDLTVGADVLSAAENMQATVYPNPSNGFFSIEFSDFTTQTSVEVYNVLGEKVFSSPLDSPHSEIDLRHKPSGIYIYHIKRENKAIATGKISIE